MKTLLVALFLLVGSSAQGQIQTTVQSHRLEPFIISGTSSLVHPQVVQGALVQPVAPQGNHKLPFSLFALPDSLNFPNDGGDHQFVGKFTNLTDTVLLVSFHRFQKLPNGWTSSICFGSNCLSPAVDTPTKAIKPFSFQPHEAKDFILHMYDSAGVPVETITTIFVRLTALTGNTADTLMLRMTGASEPMSNVVLTLAATPESISVFPNPVGVGQNVSLKVTSTSATTATLQLYDEAGRSVRSFGTANRLSIGENLIQLGSLDLPSGSYMIRMVTSSGVQLSRRFELLR